MNDSSERGNGQGADRRLHFSANDIVFTSISTLGFIGRMPKAPGTWGSLVAAILAPALFLKLDLTGRVLALVLIFVLGGFAASRAEVVLGEKDPGTVVIDELLGQWVTFLPFAVLAEWQLFVGFGLFRAFDILKPWPVKPAEKWLPGGYGIMIDDVIAGIMAMVCMMGIMAVVN